jgi:basic amino acid/polyamine antiporter, APA family
MLARRLGLWSTVGLVIGVTIGSGIFRTPAAIAGRVPDPVAMLAVWLLGGVISLCGALSVAELAARVPKTGGWYAFLREGWGRLPAFLFGWSELVLIRASATGAIALVFSSYLLRSLGYDPEASHHVTTGLAASAILVAAGLNVRGVQVGALVVGVSTAMKFSALLLLVALAWILGGSRGASATHFNASGSTLDGGLFGLALISVLWAYDGFADVAFAAGEVKDPQRTLPRAIVGGTLAIMAIYIAANLAYLYVLPIEAIARSPLIAADTMRALLGEAGGTLVAAVVAISTFGALIGISLAAPRVFFAMAEDRLMLPALARVHPRYATPYVAIGLAAALGIFFVLTRTFEQLADTFVLSIWPFYGLAVAGLYRLRRRQPAVAGGYSTPGYPVVPAVFIAGVIYLIASALYADPLWTGVTLAIVLSGTLVLLAFVRNAGR